MTARALLDDRAAIATEPSERHVRQGDAPIIAAVDGSAASRSSIATAVGLATDLKTRIVFVYVRRGPAGFLGSPVYERRLAAKLAGARRVLDDALAFAARAGVGAEAEILEGRPHQRIAEFARDRDARLVVVGSRRRKLGRSVSCGVVRAARRPVVVARGDSHGELAGPPAAGQGGQSERRPKQATPGRTRFAPGRARAPQLAGPGR